MAKNRVRRHPKSWTAVGATSRHDVVPPQKCEIFHIRVQLRRRTIQVVLSREYYAVNRTGVSPAFHRSLDFRKQQEGYDQDRSSRCIWQRNFYGQRCIRSSQQRIWCSRRFGSKHYHTSNCVSISFNVEVTMLYLSLYNTGFTQICNTFRSGISGGCL